jgi:hypothetical protein
VNAAPPDVTLQINLCAGDLAYAEPIVAALSRSHRPDVREVVVVADACRPQATPAVHAPSRFPEPAFGERIAQLRLLCERLRAAGHIDRIVWLEPDARALRTLNARYAGISTARSHDHLGHAFSAYFLGWEAARTRYVAHFDADILLWQEPGFSWIRAAITALAENDRLLAVSPRIAPPDGTENMVRHGAAGSAWSDWWPLDRVPAGWSSPWFSTRCHLMDRERLQRHLPLHGQADAESAARIERLLAPLCRLRATHAFFDTRAGKRLARRLPPFPLPPEVLLHEDAQARGFRCLYLGDPRCWFVHPDTKPAAFVAVLPHLLDSVVQRGTTPPGQRGLGSLQLPLWQLDAAAARNLPVSP